MSDILRDFDKKNEFPKVKLNLPKFDFSHLTEAVINMNSAFDNIAKDIREQKDNAMAMEFTKCIGELLRKNGVIPKITEYTREHVKEHSIEQLYGVSIDELDFSEHDKAFEDKITRLEKQIKSYEAERKELRTRCCMDSAREKFDNHSYGGLVIYTKNFTSECERRLYEENKELKQRIAELESKETESVNEMPDSITIDGYKCKIIKTESGLYISRDEIYSIIDKEKEPLKQKCKELEDKHQSDCIEINRLNTTIDVLIHKVEYLRQFAGLE